MSNQVLQPLVGMKWPFSRSNKTSTTIKTSVSGREYRTQNWAFPKYEWKLDFEVLRETVSYAEQRYLMGFVNARGGSFDSFLFSDPDDCAVVAQTIGVGDGVNKVFQLVRTWGGFVEPIFDLNGAPQVFVAGVAKATPADYAISSSGLVTFVNAPPAGQAVAWTGAFYWRVRFLKDGFEFQQFLQKLWSLNGLAFTTFKG